jgi:DNA-binding response OmpR family regulator
MRVLVADDDPVYRKLLEDLLTKWHLEAVPAEDGGEALEIMAGDDAPRLVLLDYEMPRADGFEVARTIRSAKPTQAAYVIMITGSRNRDEIMRVLVSGADDYLIKPFDPMDLKIHLRSAMRVLHLQEELERLKQPQPANG